MTAGRPPKPQQLKSLQGTTRKDRDRQMLDIVTFENVNQIKVEKLAGLESPAARKIFNQKANQLIAIKMLAPCDLEHLIIYCNAFAIILRCTKDIKENELFVRLKDDEGNETGFAANPHIKLFKDMSEIVGKIGQEFGFSPISRMKFKTDAGKKVDPLQQFLNEFNN